MKHFNYDFHPNLTLYFVTMRMNLGKKLYRVKYLEKSYSQFFCTNFYENRLRFFLYHKNPYEAIIKY